MHLSSPLRSGALVATLALVLSGLAPTSPASAAVFTANETVLDAFGGGYTYDYAGTSDCDYTPTGANEPDVPVVENGPAASQSTTSSVTFENPSIPADTATGGGGATATGKVASSGGVSTMDLSVTSNAFLSNALGTSTECVREVYAGIELEVEFTVTQPGFLTLTTTNTGTAYGEAYIYKYDPLDDETTTVYVDVYGTGSHFDGNVKVYLPVGTYRGYLEGESYKYAKASYSISGTATLHGEFHPAGSQTEAVAGKGKKYVTPAAARSCAAHSANAKVTRKAKRASQVKQVVVFVNDTKVKTVKKPGKGDTIKVPVTDDRHSAEVRTVVTLFPKEKGKPSKVVEVSATYEACT